MNPVIEKDWIRLSLWTSNEQEPDWRPLERFVKQLKLMSFRIGFEIVGNSERIVTSLLVNRRDLPVISVIFESEFEFCKLTPMGNDIFPCQSDKLWESLIFKDFFPTPPYSELLTRPMELHYSPLKSLVLAIAKLKDPAIGFYQVLTRAVQADHDWHRNVEILKDLQFNTKLHGNYNNSKSYNQQSPSGDLKMMALEIENKAHNDKPFFCVAVRVGVFDSRDEGSQALNTLTASIGLFQHGGRSLNFMSEQDYEVTLQPIDIQKMFRLGLTYRPGFLINSLEHIGFIDFLYFENYEMLGLPIKQLDKLQVKNAELVSGNGTIIGIGTIDGDEAFVRFGELESKPSVMIGKTGFGKSTLILNRSLYEIQRGYGVAIIEPHNDLTDDILERIPEQHQDRVIYLDPGDLDFVPLFNPFDRSLVGHNIGPATDNIIQGIKSFVSPTGWGARTEHLFRNIIFSLLHLPNSTFFDVSSLLRNDSKESKAFSKNILEVLENETARQFWKYDYPNLKKDELGPPRNKMSQLLLSGTPALMLSQPENKINFRKIMDEGYILLVNLSNVGPILRGVLGCFILSQFHMAALSRSKLPVDERRPFSIYVDEAYRFMTDTIEDLLVEPRKYNVSLNFAHQYLSQFDKRENRCIIECRLKYHFQRRQIRCRIFGKGTWGTG